MSSSATSVVVAVVAGESLMVLLPLHLNIPTCFVFSWGGKKKMLSLPFLVATDDVVMDGGRKGGLVTYNYHTDGLTVVRL